MTLGRLAWLLCFLDIPLSIYWHMINRKHKWGQCTYGCKFNGKQNWAVTGIGKPNFFVLEIIQFHPSYTYEDFVRGITVKSKGDKIKYKTEIKIRRVIISFSECYYDLKYSNSMLSLKEIQQRLEDDQVIVEYVLNETDTIPELYSFVISSNKIDFHKQNVNSDFISSIDSMFYFVSDKYQNYMFCYNLFLRD